MLAAIEGAIAPEGYIHLKYDAQRVDGTLHPPYDIVIVPSDKSGTVSFTVPQGISVTFEVYDRQGGNVVLLKTVTIPKSGKVVFADLL